MRENDYRLTNEEVAEVLAAGGDIIQAQESKKQAWLKANPPQKMSNWRKTVLPRVNIFKGSTPKLVEQVVSLLEEQAKATYPIAEQAGMRKVVEWLNKHDTGYFRRDVWQEDSWQAQLKIWFGEEMR